MKPHEMLFTITLTMIMSVTLISITCVSATADIYQYTDDKGVVHFSNVGVGNNKKFKKVKTAPAGERPSVSVASQPASPSALITPSSTQGSYGDIIHSACNRHGVDPALVRAIVKVESDFNPYALSRKGAMGLMQLMPQTAFELNVRNTFNPLENIDGGVKYLRYLIDRYEGNLRLALAAYNSGESAVKKWGTIPPFRETQQYVQKIMSLYTGGSAGNMAGPRYTIYMGLSDDGAILLTDDPGKHKDKKLKRKTARNL